MVNASHMFGMLPHPCCTCGHHVPTLPEPERDAIAAMGPVFPPDEREMVPELHYMKPELQRFDFDSELVPPEMLHEVYPNLSEWTVGQVVFGSDPFPVFGPN